MKLNDVGVHQNSSKKNKIAETGVSDPIPQPISGNESTQMEDIKTVKFPIDWSSIRCSKEFADWEEHLKKRRPDLYHKMQWD